MGHTPLTGTRVLDVTTSIAGPYCAQILAALGADVIKVERPDTGDDGRAWGPPFWNGEGTMFLSANAGKRSLALSLRNPRGREALLRLVDGADVFLQSLRPGLAGHRDQPTRGLHQRVVAGLVAERPDVAVRTHRAVDKSRIALSQSVRAEAELLCEPRAKALQEDVGAVDEPEQRLAATGIAK